MQIQSYWMFQQTEGQKQLPLKCIDHSGSIEFPKEQTTKKGKVADVASRSAKAL
jgi:hypothetical protein